MSLIEEIIENVVNYADYRYNYRREEYRRDLESQGLKVYFVHELVSCKKKSELKQVYAKLELELMRKPPLLLGEIVQRGVKEYLPEDVEEERIFYKILGNVAIVGMPDFYSKLRKSVYDVKFIRGEPKLLEHHKLRASMYKWLSDAGRSYLLYCSPKGFMEFEVDEKFDGNDVKSLIKNWKSPMWDWECKLCVYKSICFK